MKTYHFQSNGEFALTGHLRQPRAPSATHEAAPYQFELATADRDLSTLVLAWRRLLAGGASPEKLYQSPEFFNHLLCVPEPGTRHELFIARRRADHAIVGVVPVRLFKLDLDFRLGPTCLFKRPLEVCQILGSVPLLDPAEEGLSDYVARQLLARFPDAAGFYMQAVGRDAGVPLEGVAGLRRHLLNGWRDCHTQPLPDSVDAYLQKFSSKKRYNLSRQVRLLTQEAGALDVVRVTDPAQIDALFNARDAIAPWLVPKRAADQATAASLARQGLLLCYVIRCGNEDVALVSGLRANGVWHIYNIYHKKTYLHLSLGTSAVHLAILDVLANERIATIDFGYGSPNNEFRAIHQIVKRGQAIVVRRRSAQGLLLATHGVWNRMNEALIRQVKRTKKWLAQRQNGQGRTGGATLCGSLDRMARPAHVRRT